MPISQHNEEIHKNLRSWRNKPLLRKIYNNFHKIIADQLLPSPNSYTVELGSGIGSIKEIIPNCITTDLFPNPGIDCVENAYQLSFTDNTISNIILFDMFHHLRYPGTALNEFFRVLTPNGRVIIFDPCLSLLGLITFGLLHHERLGLNKDITMDAPPDWILENDDYYTAQGNASRIFIFNSKNYRSHMGNWTIKTLKRFSAISYIASGGYSKPQLYPDKAYPLFRGIDKLCDIAPLLFATRLLVVLEKKPEQKS